jgi:hypothetical protein
MSRIKLKYSKSETENNLYTFGAEWMTADKTEYKGVYHRYNITNEAYTEATWNESTSKPLYVYVTEPASITEYKQIRSINTQFDSIIPIQINITSEDIKLMYIMRYFLKKVNEPVYYEISQTQFNTYQSNLDTNLYLAASCKWYIAGAKETAYQPVYKLGVVDLNTTAITELQKTLPGISQKLTNPLQFYTDTDFVVPRDINLG